ncbi:hypothetical protein ACT4V8_11890 [Acinetobacter baumannii]
MNKKYSVSPQELSRRLRQQKKELLANNPKKIIEPQYIQGVHGSTMQFGVLVHNWRNGWKWFSNLAPSLASLQFKLFMTPCHLN